MLNFDDASREIHLQQRRVGRNHYDLRVSNADLAVRAKYAATGRIDGSSSEEIGTDSPALTDGKAAQVVPKEIA